jgi:hypothetical protein
MATARFQFPDGRIGRFEVPDGTSPEQAQILIEQAVSAMGVQSPTPAATDQSTVAAPAEGMQTPQATAAPVAAEAPVAAPVAAIAPEAAVAQESTAPQEGRGVLGMVGDVGRGVVEAVTGSGRETETIKALPEWTSMPELNSASFRSALTGLGTLLANPDEISQVVQANFPDTQVFQDEKGNYIFRSSLDGRDYAIKPGMRVSDIPRVIGGIAAFTPAGRATTISGAGLKSGLTQTGIEASQVAAGGEFSPTEVGLASAGGAAVPAVVKTVQAGRAAFKGQPPAAPAPAAGALAPEGSALNPAAAADTAAGAAPAAPAAAAGQMTTEELIDTAMQAGQKSIVPGRQSRAVEVLAGETAPDPKVLAAAKRLGIDEFLQPDHVTTNQVYRELAQAVKSIPGSEARQAEMKGLEQVGKRASDLIDEIGGTKDFSTLNTKLQTALQTQVDDLAKKSDKIYDDVLNKTIPKRVEVNAENILNFIRTRAEDLGGFQNLSPMEKEIFGKLAPRKVKVDGVEVEKLPTYTLLDDVRKDIGSAYKGTGPFKDADRAQLDQLYGRLSQDQLSVAAKFGVDDALKEANSLVRIRKGVEQDMTALFGKQLHQSMVSKLDKSFKALTKGDEKQLIALLKSVPEDMRSEVVASGMKTAFGRASMDRPISFNDYATFYQGLLQNKQAYAAIMSNLPQESRKQLSDLYRVSNSIAKASRERIQTGRLTAVTDQLKDADSLIGGIIGLAQKSAGVATLETGARAVGLPGAGVALWAISGLGKDKTSRQKVADAVLSSPELLRASRLVAEGQTEAGANVLAKSAAFGKFAKEMGIPKELNAKTQWILSTMQTQRQLADEQE